MSASRPYWNGYLKLSFVSCPIALYPAISAAERVSFRQVNRRTGHRLKHKLFDSVTGKAVDAADKARGYEVGENQFLVVEDRDLERARREGALPGALEPAAPADRESPPTVSAGVHERPNRAGAAADYDEDEEEDEEDINIRRPQNMRTIEIERFLPAGQIDARFFEKPYYIVPREEISQAPFAVIRDAMSREAVVGLARVVLSSRERPFLIESVGRGLRGMTLRFAHEVRSESQYFTDIPEIKLPPEMMKVAQHIIRTKSADFDITMLEDYYRTALVRMLRRKQVMRPAPVPAVKPSQENVINLMDALRRSLAAERPAKRAPRRRAGKVAAAKRSARNGRAS